MIQTIDPFCNPTGSVAKHISSIGLKIHIIMNDSDILLGILSNVKGRQLTLQSISCFITCRKHLVFSANKRGIPDCTSIQLRHV